MKSWNMPKIREWIAGKMNQAASWRVVAIHTQWLCPLCGQVGAIFKNEERLPDLVLVHLTEKCKVFLSGQTAAPYTTEALTAKKAYIEVKHHVTNDALFQQRDRSRKWYCPYCLQQTEITVPEDGKIPPLLIDEIHRHVTTCYGWDHGKGTLRTFEELTKAIAAQDRMQNTVEHVKNQMQANPAWRVKDHTGHWVCPHCRQVLRSIDVSSNILMYQTAPFPIAEHIIKDCSGARSAAATTQEVEKIAKLEAPKSEVEVRSGIPDELLASLKSEIESVRSQVGQDQELTKNLEEARKKQLMMLPDLPKIPGYDFQVIYKPCSHVAGDLYDFVKVSENEIGILQGDVSGHGVDAALVMSLSRKVFQMQARGRSSPWDTLVTSNMEIYPDLDRKTFITTAYGVLNLQTKMLKFARAGHNPLIIHNDKRDPQVLLLEPKGMAVGMDKGPRFASGLEEVEQQLMVGDMMLWYTDGVIETRGKGGAEFGIEGVIEVVKKYARMEAKVLLHMLELARTEFQVGEQEDDVTLIGIGVL
ncbi:MAG: PP2C family protein-serine/threonine phosphatase [Planctomycetota bacterium]